MKTYPLVGNTEYSDSQSVFVSENDFRSCSSLYFLPPPKVCWLVQAEYGHDGCWDQIRGDHDQGPVGPGQSLARDVTDSRHHGSLSQPSYNEGINYYNTTTGHSEPEDLDQSSIRFVTIYNQAFFNWSKP